MKTEFMLLAIYQKPFLTFQETCDAIGISLQAGYNARNLKQFPIPVLEKPIRVSIQDIAEYIDQQREIAKEKVSK